MDVTVRQRVERIKAGDPWWRRGAWRQPTWPREPAKPRVQHVQQHETDPKHRQRRTQEGEHSARMVCGLVLSACGERAERDAADPTDEEGTNAELKCCRKPVSEIAYNTLSRSERRAEITLCEVAEIGRVLFGNRAVEAPSGLRRVDYCGVAELTLSDNGDERVRGDQARDRERDMTMPSNRNGIATSRRATNLPMGEDAARRFCGPRSALEAEESEIEVAACAVVHSGDVGGIGENELRVDNWDDDGVVDHRLAEVGVGLRLRIA